MSGIQMIKSKSHLKTNPPSSLNLHYELRKSSRKFIGIGSFLRSPTLPENALVKRKGTEEEIESQLSYVTHGDGGVQK